MGNAAEVHVVTGALGYSGKHIAARLLAAGRRVRTLTNSPERSNPFGSQLEIHPFNFDQPARLAESLRGVSVLYNTYWVRFNYGGFNQQTAEANTLKLFEAARAAGVPRVVHVSITNPSADSPLEYFRRKAHLEQALIQLASSYAILRPAVLFGDGDILVNNIAWMLRRFPVLAVFGDGQYRLQPIHVDDFAQLAVEQGGVAQSGIINAIGPETFTYRGLVEQLGRIIGRPRPLISIPAPLGFLGAWLLGFVLRDIVLTRAEVEGLMQDLLYVDAPPVGKTKLTEWAAQHADSLGRRYASELARRRDRKRDYEKL